MAWDFSTDPDFQKKLDWVEEFCKEEVEPLEFVFPYAVRSPDPRVKAYVRGLQQQIKDLENERARWIRTAAAPANDQVRRLLGLKGIGRNSAWL